MWSRGIYSCHGLLVKRTLMKITREHTGITIKLSYEEAQQLKQALDIFNQGVCAFGITDSMRHELDELIGEPHD